MTRTVATRATDSYALPMPSVSGVPVKEQSLQQPTLEEAFLQIVGAKADRPLAEARS